MDAIHINSIIQEIGRKPRPGYSFVILDANSFQRGLEKRSGDSTGIMLSGTQLFHNLGVNWCGRQANCSVWEVKTKRVGEWRLMKRHISMQILAMGARS